jgi:UPF0755 protein
MIKLFTKLAGLAIILASLFLGWQAMEYNAFLNTPLASGDATFEIKTGSSVKSVAQQLARQGFTKNPLYFEIFVRLNNKGKQIQAGEYQIKSGMVPEELLSKLTSGEVIQYGLTIIEGWSFRQLLQAIAEHPQIGHTLDGLENNEIIAKLDLNGDHPEGWFLPDTYHFPKNTTDIDFLNRANKAMRAALEQAWRHRQDNLPLKTPYEALTLASIVEKETGLVSERRQIAGVFIRRLQKGMRLQTDPTVIYGMAELYNGNIRRADLGRDTPYNTYTRKGLPPTPIALPSLDAIKAVLDPVHEKALYFVSKGDGSHYFSETLDEHNRAVRKYQLKRH